MITKSQIAKLVAGGKVIDVEDGSMDDGRFFVHLSSDYTWNDGYGIQHSKSFGNYRDVVAALKSVIPVQEDPVRIATFDADRYTLTLWLSPNMLGERSCNTPAQAKRLIKATGVSQTLK